MQQKQRSSEGALVRNTKQRTMQKEWCLTPICSHPPSLLWPQSSERSLAPSSLCCPSRQEDFLPSAFLLQVEQPLLVAHGLQPLTTLIALLQQRPSLPVQMTYVKMTKILLKRKFWYVLTSCERFVLTFKASSILQFMLRESLLGKFVSSSDQTDEGNQTWQS